MKPCASHKSSALLELLGFVFFHVFSVSVFLKQKFFTEESFLLTLLASNLLRAEDIKWAERDRRKNNKSSACFLKQHQSVPTWFLNRSRNRNAYFALIEISHQNKPRYKINFKIACELQWFCESLFTVFHCALNSFSFTQHSASPSVNAESLWTSNGI